VRNSNVWIIGARPVGDDNLGALPPSSMPVLSASQIESFIERGLCVLPQAFDATLAAAARARIWERLRETRGIREDDRSTWPEFAGLEERVRSPEVLACFTPRLIEAIEELVGPDRWLGIRDWGLWPINFSLGAHEPWAPSTWGWHIDGNWFVHTLDCPKQGLLVIGLFSDVGPRGGGTLFAQGSHRRCARVLAQHPQGLTYLELFAEVLREPIGDLVEATGAAGDVYLVHPWLFHTRSQNHSGTPRFMSNTEAPLAAPMCFARDDGAYSVLETSILRALASRPETPAHGLQARF
jgi:hypothetical protein